MRLLLIALVTTTSLQAQMPYGYDWLNSPPSPGVIKRSAAAQSSAPSSKAANPWRLSVGYAVRSFEADFKMSAPSIGLIAPYLGGYGDVGLYRGGAGFLNYEDGYVGPSNGDGTAGGRVTSSWTTPNGQTFEIPTNDPNFLYLYGYELSEETFHTKTFAMMNREASFEGHGNGAGAYLRLSKTLAQASSRIVGYTVTLTSLRGELGVNAEFGHPTRIDNDYSYDRVAIRPSPGIVYGLVIDANALNDRIQNRFGIPGPFRNPRQSTTQFDVPEWTAVGRSYLDVRLNEIFLSADVTWKPWRGWQFGLSAGPTINVVSTTLNARAAWVRNDGLTVAGETTRQNDTHVALGAGVQGVARHDLTSDGRAFIEAHAGYMWLNDIAINGPSSSAKLDLSDWEVGLGVGIRLDDWPSGSPWTVRVGAFARRVSLKSGAVDRSSLKSIFNHHYAAPGLANGRDSINYEDGRIIGDGVNTGRLVIYDDGPDSFTINDPNQANLGIVSTGWGPDSTQGHILFHSHEYGETLVSSHARGLEEAEGLLSPSIEISKTLLVGGPLSFGVTWGCSSISTNLSLGPSLTGDVTTRRTGDLITYAYPFVQFSGQSPGVLSSYPYTGMGLVADPGDSGYGAPYQSSTPFSDTIHYFALTSASVDVSMQTFSFATDLSWKPLKHLEVGVSAGPTVNVVSTSTDLTTDWIRQDGLLFARLQDHEAQTQLRFGWRMLASARYDLDRDGRWFAEARGGYEWMQNIDLGIGLQAASLDASSWQVGAGLGCRLGVKPKMAEIRHLSSRQSRVKPEPESQNWRDRLLWRARSTVVND